MIGIARRHVRQEIQTVTLRLKGMDDLDRALQRLQMRRDAVHQAQ